MKKSIFTLCSVAALVLPLSVIAQPITIKASTTSTSFKGVEADSIANVLMDTSFVAPSFAADTAYTWDMTHMRYGSFFVHAFASSNPPYQFQDSVGYSIGGPIHYYANSGNFLVLSGKQEHVQNMPQQTNTLRRAHDTATISFMAQSSFLFGPGKTNTLTDYLIMPFPLTYRALDSVTWGADFHVARTFTMLETDTSMHIKTIPAQGKITNYYKETDTVIGYGQMTVNSANYDTTTNKYLYSKLIHVLQVKTVRSYYDSLYLPKTFQHRILDSIGIPGSTFDTLGVYVKHMHTVYEQNFYTKQLMSPLAKITFTDSTMSVVQSVQISVSNLAGVDQKDTTTTTSVEELENGNKISVYPNPMTNGRLFVELQNGQDGSWAYDFISISGQVLSSGSLSLNAYTTKAQISLPGNYAAGMYFLRISNDGHQVMSRPVVISK